MRKIELALFDADTRCWKGLTLIDGELFKVNLFPGSATEEWQAVLMTGAFVELTPGNKLTQAIERAYNDHIKASQPLTRSEVDNLTELVAGKPEALKEIMAALKGGKDT